jgi:hypothetical protein
MGRGRPRKPSAVRHLEGNRSGTPIPPDLPLHGFPDSAVDRTAEGHFRFLAAEFGGVGVLKRADSPALWKLAITWELMWKAADIGDVDAFCKLSARWDAAASKLGLQVVDRAKLMAGVSQDKPDATEERFFNPRVVG